MSFFLILYKTTWKIPNSVSWIMFQKMGRKTPEAIWTLGDWTAPLGKQSSDMCWAMKRAHEPQGWKFKISKFLNFWNSNFKTYNIHNFKFKWSVVFRLGKAITNSLIQNFEADFLWKVSLKILNSGIILKLSPMWASTQDFGKPLSHHYFCPENVECFLPLLHIFKCFQTRFFHGSKYYEPWLDCSQGGSLIWVHIICNKGYPRT